MENSYFTIILSCKISYNQKWVLFYYFHRFIFSIFTFFEFIIYKSKNQTILNSKGDNNYSLFRKLTKLSTKTFQNRH